MMRGTIESIMKWERWAMDILFHWARMLHIASGFAALLVFWLPLVAKKGGQLHRRVGWFYVWAMAMVSVTAFFMGIYRLTWNPGPGHAAIPFAWFLLFIAILSSATAWYGIRVLRFKRRTKAHRQLADLFFPVVLLGSGIGMSTYGWAISFPLLQYFPLLGLFLGGSQLLYWLRAPKLNSHFIVEHIVGMMSCCIATVTAFTVFGAPRLLNVESVSLFVWFAPTLILVPLLIGFASQYRRKMDRPKKTA